MENLNKKQKIIFIGMAAIMCITIGYYFCSVWHMQEDSNTENINVVENTMAEQVEKKKIVVHITGCIENEGIVELKEGDRIADAIDKAGGLTSDADISKINLAYKLKDGQKIYVPSNIESEEKEIVTEKSEGIENSYGNASQNTSGKVNINTATQTELETLPRNRTIYGKKDTRVQK